ncbi:MAG: YraN family protein [Oscillospiraceae bacterium]|nr:YraN family protein [Oscillospiraceae bacterium]
MTRAEIGKMGEDAVCRYLEERGYTIRDRNFRIRGGEIDIVAQKDDFLCIVEVKTRKLDAVESGMEAVTRSKMKRLIRACYIYCEKRGIGEHDYNFRYDIADVSYWNGHITDIDYLESAFDESDHICDEIFGNDHYSW